MLPLSTFDLTKEPLLDLLKAIQSGKVQLADFQREWRWEDERIRLLLASISLGFRSGIVNGIRTKTGTASLETEISRRSLFRVC